jgi:hypothetical protein
VALGARDLRPEAVDPIDDRQDVALGGDRVVERLLDQVLERLAQRRVEGVRDGQTQAVAVPLDGNHGVAACEGTGERLGDQVVVDAQGVDLQVADAGGTSERLRDRVLVELAMRARRVGEARGGDDLGGGHVVARGGLGADRADAVLEDATVQRGRARRDLPALLRQEELRPHQQLEQLLERERHAQLAGLDTTPRRAGPLSVVSSRHTRGAYRPVPGRA